MLLDRRRTEEEAAQESLAEYRGKGLLVSGLPEVLELTNRFLIRRLFVDSRLTRAGWVCREHHYLDLKEGRCPFCGRELFPTDNVVDELIEFARLYGVKLMVFEQRPELLDPYEGVATVPYDFVREVGVSGDLQNPAEC